MMHNIKTYIAIYRRHSNKAVTGHSQDRRHALYKSVLKHLLEFMNVELSAKHLIKNATKCI